MRMRTLARGLICISIPIAVVVGMPVLLTVVPDSDGWRVLVAFGGLGVLACIAEVLAYPL